MQCTDRLTRTNALTRQTELRLRRRCRLAKKGQSILPLQFLVHTFAWSVPRTAPAVSGTKFWFAEEALDGLLPSEGSSCTEPCPGVPSTVVEARIFSDLINAGVASQVQSEPSD